jgi:hypothetical protein
VILALIVDRTLARRLVRRPARYDARPSVGPEPRGDRTGARDAIVFTYPARIKADPAGRFLVTFRDLPEALTDGASLAEARREAADCLATAIA